MRRVLFVDDEPQVLDGLSKSLRSYRHRWAVEFAGGGEQALELLERHPFEVVISDARMPGIDGEQLLGAVQARWPSTVRIILSGQTEPDCGRRLIHLAHQFIAKPIHSSDLFDTVERACRLGDLLGAPGLKQIIGGLDRLPSFPWLHSRLSQALDQPAVALVVLARIISQDPALGARALQMVNSAFFGLARPVVSIHDAVCFLGKEACRELLRSTNPYLGDGPMLDELNRRATLLARLSSLALSGTALAEGAYAAGLMSQLGALVLASRMGATYEGVWRAHLAGMRLEEAELEQLGSSHCEIGAGLLGLWNVPGPLVDAVALHLREPLHEQNPDITSALTLASALEEEQRLHPSERSRADQLGDRFGLGARLPALRQIAADSAGAAG